MGGTRSSYSSTQFVTLFTSLLLLLLLPSVQSLSNNTLPTLLHINSRKAIEIGIGIGIGGGGSSPPPESEPGNCPPPPSGPQPCDFENILLYRAYFVIQRFKQTITCDPQGIIDSWKGYDLCRKNTKDAYRGFFCATPPRPGNTLRNIASIDFNGYNLAAPTLQGFVDGMPDLAIFHANSNNFSGTVPDLKSLNFFYELDVSNNRLMGSFPMNVLPLTKLTFLDLRFNQFSGRVPPSVFTIQLDVLFINNNNLEQGLPSALGRTTAQYLTLANNRFTGPIPTSIGQACNTLLEVLFLNNLLSGCLPYEIGLLTKATVFDAGTNQITGTIPLSFGCLMKVEQLNLARNRLYGEVPDVVCLLADFGKLANLSLSSNYFTWLGPSCLKLIKSRILDVRDNCIPGLPDQRSPEECDWFLRQPKYCHVLPYIPCHIPWMDGQSAAAMLPEVEGGRYTGYSALHNGHGP